MRSSQRRSPADGSHPRQPLQPWRRLVALGMIACVLPAAGGEPAAATPDEARTKAEYLVHLADFVEWPATAFADPKAPILIGLVGEVLPETGAAVLAGATVRGRKIEVRRFRNALEVRPTAAAAGRQDTAVVQRQVQRLGELRACHIVFVSASERDYTQGLLGQLRGRPILTVGDAPAFTHLGGMIAFFTAGGRLTLEINEQAARQAGLQVSSKLLQMAKRVDPPPAPADR